MTDERLEFILNRVRAYYNILKFKEGVNYLIENSSLFKDNVDFYILLLEGYFKLKDFKKSYDFALKVLEYDKENKYAYYVLSYIKYIEGDLKNSLDLIDKYNLINIKEAFYLKLEVLHRLNKYQEIYDNLNNMNQDSVLQDKFLFRYYLYSLYYLQKYDYAYNILIENFSFQRLKENKDFYEISCLTFLKVNKNIDLVEDLVKKFDNINVLIKLAEYYFNKNDYNKSIEILNIVKFDDLLDNLDYINLMIRSYFSLNYYNYVVDIFDKVKTNLAISIDLKRLIAISYFKLKKYKLALQLFLEYNKIKTADFKSVFYIAESYYYLEKYLDAVFFYEKLLDKSIKYNFFPHYIFSLYKLEAYDSLINYIKTDIKRDILVNYVYYKFYLKIEKYDLAYKYIDFVLQDNNFILFENVLEVFFDYLKILYKLGRYKEFIEFYKEKENKLKKLKQRDFLKVLLYLSESYFFVFQIDKAIENYRIIINKYEDFLLQEDKEKLLDIYYRLSLLYFDVDLTDESFKYYLKVLKESYNSQLLIDIIKRYLKKEDFINLKNAVDRFAEKFPESAMLYYFKAELELIQKNNIEAKSYLYKALSLNKLLPEIYYTLSMVEYSEKNIDKSYNYLKEAERLGCSKDLLYNMYGMIFMAKGDYKNAESNFLKSLEYNSDNIEALYNLSVIYTVKGDYKLAERYLKDIIEMDKFFIEAYINLALLYLNVFNKLDLCLKILKEALVADPKSDKVYFYLGITYETLGEFEIALKYFNMAKEFNKEIDPALLLYHIGLVYSQKSDIDKVLAIYKQLKELNRSYADKLLLKTKGL